MSQIFEKATKTRLRFVTEQGNLSTEDLWRLSLGKLNVIALDLRSNLEALTGASFIEEDAKPDARVVLAFEVVKHIIDVKLVERKEAAEKADRAGKKAKLLELIARKQDENMEGLSIEELTKQFDELG